MTRISAPIYYRSPEPKGIPFPYEFTIAFVLAVVLFVLFCA